jgi:dephospho-CoA kinase
MRSAARAAALAAGAVGAAAGPAVQARASATASAAKRRRNTSIDASGSELPRSALTAPYDAAVKRVLITGMSATGKSTVLAVLAARGYKTVDTDDGGWTELADVVADSAMNGGAAHETLWREDRIASLLATEDADVLFISGAARNQVKFYGQFDHIVLLTAPEALTAERLARRTNNPYGKRPGELSEILALKRTVEPLLRRSADLEVDTSASLDEVVATILSVVLR